MKKPNLIIVTAISAIILFFTVPNTVKAQWAVGGNTLTANSIFGSKTASGYDVLFYANNAEAMRLTHGGNIGIGTSSPSSLLHLYSTIGGSYYLSKFEDGNDDGGLSIGLNNSSGSIQSYRVSTSATDKLLLNASGGLVGIGTTSPSAYLDITGAKLTDASLLYQNIIRSTDAYNASPTAGIDFLNQYTNEGNYAGMGGISVAKLNATSGDYSSFLCLHTRNNGGNITERVRIDNVGNVGIGTTIPGANLAVNGTSAIFGGGTLLGSYSSTTAVELQSTGSTTLAMYSSISGGNGHNVQLADYSPFGYWGLIGGTNGTGTATPFTISNGGAERMRITTSGNVGIGTTVPNGLLNVVQTFTGSSTDFYNIQSSATSTGSGNGAFSIVSYATGDCSSDLTVGIKCVATGASLNYGVYGEANGGGGACGGTGATNYAGYFAGNLNYTGLLNGVSDQKFKENIVSIDNALDVINALHPRKYTMSTNPLYARMNFPKGEHYGFIAQELEKVIPQVVSDNVHPPEFDKKGNKIADKIDYKGVDYISIIPFIVAGMKEQQKLIINQKSTIDSLRMQISNCCSNKLQNVNSIGSGNVATTSDISATLSQNTPNPFSQQTNIKYFVPINSQSAKIMIFDLQGKLMKTASINNYGDSSVTINGNELSAGMFVYSLIVNGQLIDTKRMILTE